MNAIIPTPGQTPAMTPRSPALTDTPPAGAPPTMAAIAHERYGDFTGLALRTVPVPAPARGEVRLRVTAAALHVGDCFGVRGSPWMMRIATGLLRPNSGIPGFDVAGVVESVGKDVTRFAPGDRVFGASSATCAQWVCAKANTVAHIPAGLDAQSMAALPTSGLAALHALRDVAKLRPGDTILINGASGGVGHFAVQIAKATGATVTAVCSTKNVTMVRALGADHVIDYCRDDFTQTGHRYDVIFDNVENRNLGEIRRALAPRGTLVLNSGTGARGMAMLVRLLRPLVLSPFVRQRLRRYLSTPNHEDLTALATMAANGALRPTIERVVPLQDVPAALAHIEGGHAAGKVVVNPGS